MLLHYRDQELSNEPIQTNFFVGDNDNYQEREKDDPDQPARDAESKLEMRPSVNEMFTRITGVPTDTIPAFKDSLGNQRPEMVVPIESKDVERDKTSRSVTKREREAAFAEHTANMSPEQLVEYAKKNKPTRRIDLNEGNWNTTTDQK